MIRLLKVHAVFCVCSAGSGMFPGLEHQVGRRGYTADPQHVRSERAQCVRRVGVAAHLPQSFAPVLPVQLPRPRGVPPPPGCSAGTTGQPDVLPPPCRGRGLLQVLVFLGPVLFFSDRKRSPKQTGTETSEAAGPHLAERFLHGGGSRFARTSLVGRLSGLGAGIPPPLAQGGRGWGSLLWDGGCQQGFKCLTGWGIGAWVCPPTYLSLLSSCGGRPLRPGGGPICDVTPPGLLCGPLLPWLDATSDGGLGGGGGGLGPHDQ